MVRKKQNKQVLIVVFVVLGSFFTVLLNQQPAHAVSNTYYVSPDGGVSISKDTNTAPSNGQCTTNAASPTTRINHFDSIEAAFRCTGSGDSVVINAMNAGGTIVPYHEMGFGTGTKPAPTSGISAAHTKVIGRCNVDIAGDNRTFLRSSCKPLIQPVAADWGLSVSATDATAAIPAESSKTIFMGLTGSQAYIDFDNLEFDGATGLLDGSGNWTGANCVCRATGFLRIDYPAHDFIFNHVNVHNTTGTVLYTFSSVANGNTNISWTNSNLYHNGWNYLGSMTLRFGAVGSSPTCTDHPEVSGCPTYYGEYYSHTHSLYIGTGGNTFTGNYIYDDAGSCIQFFNGVFAAFGNNTVTGNWIANCGWKSKLVPESLNNAVGWNVQYSNPTTINNNVFLNNVGGYSINAAISLSTNMFIHNGVGNMSGTGVYTPVLQSSAVRNIPYINNIMCFNRDDTATAKDEITWRDEYGSGLAPYTGSITGNTQLGQYYADGSRTLSSNTGNTYGGCSTNAYTTSDAYTPSAGVVARDTTLTPGILLQNVYTVEDTAGPTIPALCATGTRTEAENMTRSGGGTNADGAASNSADFGSYFTGSYVTWNYTAAGGTYDIVFRYYASSGAARKLTVDAAEPGNTITFAVSAVSAYVTVTLSALYLNPGSRVFKLAATADSGSAVDYVDICPISAVTTTTTTPVTTTTTTTTINPTTRRRISPYCTKHPRYRVCLAKPF